jgi:AhpD family alkylhydroperoxidase
MDARLNPYDGATTMNFVKYLNSSGAVVTDSKLPAKTQELVKIRASQINGCSGCLDMHTKDAEHRGESLVRLHLVGAWREATVFTEPPWSSPSKVPASRMPMASPTKPGRTRPSTTTTTNSERWCA